MQHRPLENLTAAQLLRHLMTDYMHQALLENLTTTKIFKNLLTTCSRDPWRIWQFLSRSVTCLLTTCSMLSRRFWLLSSSSTYLLHAASLSGKFDNCLTAQELAGYTARPSCRILQQLICSRTYSLHAAQPSWRIWHCSAAQKLNWLHAASSSVEFDNCSITYWLHAASPSWRIWQLLRFSRTYLLTTCSRTLLENLTTDQQLKNFPAWCGIQSPISVFRHTRHWTQSWYSWRQSVSPYLVSQRLVLIFSYAWKSDVVFSFWFSNRLLPLFLKSPIARISFSRFD
jgi:hypothetical protein